MNQINPQDFIITRKRKLYRFALFANSPLCFELAEWKKRPVDTLELGAGTAHFSVELATRYPKRKFVAVDVKADRLQKGARLAESRGLQNIWFVRARADQMDQVVSKKSLSSLWLTFPDPFAKKRSAGRRMTHPNFLKLYAGLIKKDGSLYLKHDDASFFHWSLEQLVAEKWHIAELSFDLHGSDLSDDYKTLTTYELRWLEEGALTNFVRASRDAS
jgi:tRNA (guanine-N7-)-methyltransferase